MSSDTGTTSSNSFVSMLVEILFMCVVLAIFVWYNRRRQASIQTKRATTKGSAGLAPKTTGAKVMGKSRDRKLCCRATSEALSSESTDTGVGSLQGSDTEVSSVETVGGSVNPRRQGASSPPGLAPRSGVQGHQAPHRDYNACAMQMCPPLAKNALNTPGLQELVSRLSPQDAATVMASLNAASCAGYPDSHLGVGTPVVFYPVVSAGNLHRESCDPRYFRQATHQRSTMPAQSNNMKVRKVSSRETVESVGSTLKDNLRELSLLDNKRVIMVRKINKLGLKSPQLLEVYFSQFGVVDRVFVTHSIEKKQDCKPRWRPAGLGFVVMSKAEDAAAVLGRKDPPVVLGHEIAVFPYEDHFAAKAADALAEDESEVQ